MGRHVYLYIFFLFFLFQQPLFAGLNVNPVVIEVVVPKEGITQTIQVGNTGEKPIKVRIELNKLHKKDGEIELWFKIMPHELEINPGEIADFSYVITPLEDAEGELRCMIFLVADEVGEKKSNLGIRFGVPVYAIVKETVKLDAEVGEIKIEYNSNKKELQGIVYVKNKGNIHIRPFVDLDIQKEDGTVVNSFEIPFGQPAQVGQNRPFMFNQRIEIHPGKYKLKASVDYGKMYGLKDYVATKEVEFEVKTQEGEVVKETPEPTKPVEVTTKETEEMKGAEIKTETTKKIGGGQ